VPALLSPGELVLPKSIVNGNVSDVVGFMESLGVKPKKAGFGDFVSDVLGGAIDAISGGIDFTQGILSGVATGDLRAIEDTINRFGNNLFNIVGTLGEKILPEPLRSILRSLREIGSAINVKDLIRNPVGAIKDAVKSVTDTFLKPGIKKLINPIPGLQGGGLIGPGFPNDSALVGVSSGELIVPSDLTSRLEDFIDRQDNNNRQENNIDREILMRIVDALETPMTATATVDFNQDTLADIILTLNRGNRRLA